ncbi:MAG: ribosome small subunit-dependent GTPase A [Oscillospiraceae bacterium]|nr:ribosome small subunit-dependent GTPase A [Oscillospiraceae bacterium]
MNEYTINMKDYGYKGGALSDESHVPARITAVHRERFEAVCPYGIVSARTKTGAYRDFSEDYPTAGDFVELEYNPIGDSLITATLPRRSFFSRRDPTPGRGEQAVAANFDYVFIMQSLNHDLNPKRLERYLTLSWQSGAIPVILLTKADISDNINAAVAELSPSAAGAEIIPISSKTGYGLDRVREFICDGKTAVFAGSSGVEKSTLVNALAGEDIMSVSGIRENDSKGRHTTTHRQLIRLENGGMIIDTPGMRELGMWDVSKGIGEAFEDVEEFTHMCRFSDCRHESEPGCAVRAAIERGELSEERWESYKQLKAEAEISDREELMRRKRQFMKDVAVNNKNRRKHARRFGGKDNY